MDYRKLIKQLRNCKSYKPKYELQHTMLQAAAAIETLLAEREAAVEEMHGRCTKCKHFSVGILDYPCTDCRHEGGANDHWQWRGPTQPDRQKEDCGI